MYYRYMYIPRNQNSWLLVHKVHTTVGTWIFLPLKQMTPKNNEQVVDFNIGSKRDWEKGGEREWEKKGDEYACTCTVPY